MIFVLSSNSLHQNTRPINRPSLDSRLGTGSVDGASVLMEGVRGQHEHHNKQNNDKEENKGLFAEILLLKILQSHGATCDLSQARRAHKIRNPLPDPAVVILLLHLLKLPSSFSVFSRLQGQSFYF